MLLFEPCSCQTRAESLEAEFLDLKFQEVTEDRPEKPRPRESLIPKP